MALRDAKAACHHGEWLPFLGELGFKERTARTWMQYSRVIDARLEGGNGIADAVSLPAIGETLREDAIPNQPSDERVALEDCQRYLEELRDQVARARVAGRLPGVTEADRFRVSDKALTTLTSQRDEWQRKTEVTEAEAEGWKRQAA